MASSNNATILIADISGFTEFMTSTELNHGSFAINIFIESIIKTVGDEYEVSEIEGDAVLLIRKGSAPTKNEIQKTCVNIFNAFHFQRKWMQQHAICPCGACLAIVNLTLKFIAHHGPLAEIKVGRFVKQSGPEMIVAHRLLKNSIDNNEYLLITEKLLNQEGKSSDSDVSDLQWTPASDVYASIGKINYDFALLNDARKGVPDPPPIEAYFTSDHHIALELSIQANFRDVYMVVMDIPGRVGWVSDLKSVEQDMPGVFIGSIHRCTFDQYKAMISPRHMTTSPNKILYVESCTIESLNLILLYEYEFVREDNQCLFSCRILPGGNVALLTQVIDMLTESAKHLAEKLKGHCEQLEVSFFEPFFQRR